MTSLPPHPAQPPPERSFRPWLLAALILIVILLITNLSLLLGRSVPIWDADRQAIPWQILVADYARHFRLLHWDPWTAAGSPDFAEPQFGAMSPITLAFAFITGPSVLGYCLYWFFWWSMAGVGMLLFARSLKAPLWIAFIVSLGFTFSGVFLGDAEHIPFVIAHASLPWIVWRFDVGLRSRRLLPLLQSGALWGLCGLAGYPGIVISTGLFLFVWTLLRAVSDRCVDNPPEGATSRLLSGMCLDPSPVPSQPKPPRKTLFFLLAPILTCLLGAIVLSPTYLSFLYEAHGYTDRSGPLPYELAVESNALHPRALATIASPYLPLLHFFNPLDMWPYTDISGSPLYIGALTLTLALYSLIALKNASPASKRFRLGLLVLAIAALCLAMGVALPFRGWLYYAVLPTRYFRHSVNFRLFAIFCLCTLALEGARSLLPDLAARSRSLILATLLAAFIAIGSFLYLSLVAHDHGPSFFWNLALVHMALAWISPILLAVLARQRIKVAPTDPSQPPILKRIVLAFLLLAVADACLTRTLSEPLIETRDPHYLDSWAQIQKHHSDSLDLTSHGFTRAININIPVVPNNKNLPLKMPVLISYSTMLNASMTQWTDDPLLVELACGSRTSRHSPTLNNQIWFSPTATETSIAQQDFESFLKRAHQLHALPAVIHSRGVMLRDPNADLKGTVNYADVPAATLINCKVTLYDPDQLTFDVQCPDSGWIFLTDRWSRSWTATVNNTPQPVLGGAMVFRALHVEKGNNHIDFRFTPIGMPWLLILSWVTLAIVAIGTTISEVIVKLRAQPHGGSLRASSLD